MAFSKLLTVLVLLLYTTGDEVFSCTIMSWHDAEKGRWPWMVHLNISNTDGTKKWRCGGVLLNNQWVLTAAHCFKKNPEPDFIRTGVWIGAYELHKGAERYRTIVYPVYPTYRHYHDTGRGYENDIVLLKLTKKVEFTDNIAPINLPDKSPIDSFSDCWITGWGQIREGVPLPAPETLQQLKVSIMSKSRCKEAYPHLTSAILCAGDGGGGWGACDGDYGGPLVCRGSTGFTLVGIMSYGGPRGCSGPGRPVVFAQVSEYLEFINYYINLPS